MTETNDNRNEDAQFEALLGRSSLGAPGARQLRERIPLAEARAIISMSAPPAAAAPVGPPEFFAQVGSLEEFFTRYWPRLLRSLIAQASDSSLAEEAASEAFVAAMDKWDMLFTLARPDSWLYKVATRRLRRMEAQARARGSLVETRADIEADLRQVAAFDEWVAQHMDLIVAMRLMPRRQAEVLAWRTLGECTEQETAEILGVTEGTVKQQMSRARKKLRVLLEVRAAS